MKAYRTGKLQVQGRGEDVEFYFPVALGKLARCLRCLVQYLGLSLAYLFLTDGSPLSLPGLGASLGSLGTTGLQGACLYRPESGAQEHFSLDLIMWEK